MTIEVVCLRSERYTGASSIPISLHAVHGLGRTLAQLAALQSNVAQKQSLDGKLNGFIGKQICVSMPDAASDERIMK